MRRSLFLIQNMVPSMLADQASLLNLIDHSIEGKLFSTLIITKYMVCSLVVKESNSLANHLLEYQSK